MALATRELELIIIAKDRASTVLARVGGAMAVLGAGVARVGAAGIGEFIQMTEEAIDFRKQIALAFTQAEIAGLKYNDVLEMVRKTARETSVPIEDLAASTFDIFSTITLDNMEQAQGLLDAFAKSAMAGDAPIQDIGRSTLAWLNALAMEPTLENVNRILDIQFELVRKGAGTYEEFAAVIGRAIPAFVNAGQSIETASGVIAFLTRNGLSAAMAATSAARAVELLFSPKAIKGLGKIGIRVEDASGHFRDMDDILEEVVGHFQGLTDAQKKIEFKEIFGIGSIQARRFFDVLMAEGNLEEFLFILDEIQASGGSVEEAFNTMLDQPAVKLDIIRNRFRILRQEIGDRFIPLLEDKVIPFLERLLDKWDALDEVQKDNLVKWAAFATVFVTVGGALAAITGSLVLMFGLFKALSGSALMALLLGGGWALAIAAVAGAIALAVIDFEKFKELFGPVWERVLEVLEPIALWIRETFPEAWEKAEGAWDNVVDFFENDWPVIWDEVQAAVQEFIDFFVGIWDDRVVPAWEDFSTFFEERAQVIKDAIGGLLVITDDLEAEWTNSWETIKSTLGADFEQISSTVRTFMELILTITGTILAIVAAVWNEFGDDILKAVTNVWNTVHGVVRNALRILEGIWKVVIGILTLDWDKFWGGLGDIVAGAFGIISAIVSGAFTGIANNFGALLELIPGWDGFWTQVKIIAERAINTIITLVNGLIVAINSLSPFTDIATIPLVDLPGTNSGIGGENPNFNPGGPDRRGGGGTRDTFSPEAARAGVQINMTAQTDADPQQIARDIAWEVMNA